MMTRSLRVANLVRLISFWGKVVRIVKGDRVEIKNTNFTWINVIVAKKRERDLVIISNVWIM